MCIMDNGNDLPTWIPFLEISDEKHDFNKINSDLMSHSGYSYLHVNSRGRHA